MHPTAFGHVAKQKYLIIGATLVLQLVTLPEVHPVASL
jgi:hypothetical protein